MSKHEPLRMGHGAKAPPLHAICMRAGPSRDGGLVGSALTPIVARAETQGGDISAAARCKPNLQ